MKMLYIYLMRQYNFYTYILTNYSKKVIYTGVTNDLDRRLYEHYFGLDQQESFTNKYKCHYLVWYERHQYINNAIEREKEIKGWLRGKKIRLIEEENPNWNFLNKDIMEWPPVRTH
jgi:putative endonuclease